MLICPECQSENPSDNKYCQECGASLTTRQCPDCRTEVALDAKQCHNCGADVAIRWWAVVTHENPDCLANADYLATDFLDANRRYQILSIVSPSSAELPIVQLQLLDCNPFQMSELEILFSRQSEAQNLSSKSEPWTRETQETIPSTAQPYLDLNHLDPALPAIYDAWLHPDYQVIIVEDRSQWPYLSEFWTDNNSQFAQRLYWLHEMTQLWSALEPWNCQSNLLQLDNLRVDEDQVLCLQCLIPNPQIKFELRDLGAFWRSLFHQLGPESCPALLDDLIDQLEAGAIDDTEILQDQLEKIARQLDENGQPIVSSDDAPTDALERVPGTLPASAAEPTPSEDLSMSQVWAQVVESDHGSQVPPEAAEPDFPASDSPVSDSPTSDVTKPLEVMRGGRYAENDMGSDPISAVPTDEDLTGPTTEPDLGASQEAAMVTMPTGLGSDDDDDEEAVEENTPTVVLPMQLVSLSDAGRTDVGRQRDHNEDFFAVQTDISKIESPHSCFVKARGLYVLCDGMGGHASGEVASALAAGKIKEYFEKTWLKTELRASSLPTEEEIREAVFQANQAIFDVNQQSSRSGSGRMGTTLVVVLVQNTQVAVAHVGDSRLYRLSRRNGLEQVTRDHDVGQREILRGVDPAIAYARPDALQLTQALGPRGDEFVNPDIQFLDLNEDTLLLLCSDGLADNDLLETHWRTHVEPLLSSRANLDQGVAQLIDLANEYNGHDNITALVIRLKMRPNMDLMNR